MKTESTISQLIDQYISERDIKQTSLHMYRFAINQFFRWVVRTNRDPKRLGPADIVSYKSEIKATHKMSTVDMYLNSLKGFYKWLNESGIVDRNITASIHNSDKNKGFRKRPVNMNQIITLLSSIDRKTLIGKRNYAIICLLYFNGLRVSEVQRVNVEDVSLETQELLILGKARWTKETVMINTKVCDAIHEYQQALIQHNHVTAGNDPLFLGFSNKQQNRIERINSISISILVKQQLRKAGINSPDITAHSLRHSSAVHMIQAKKSLYDVQLFLRHTSPIITQHYTRYAEDYIRTQTAQEDVLLTKYNETIEHVNNY